MTRSEAFQCAQRAASQKGRRWYAIRYGASWTVADVLPRWDHDGHAHFDPEPEPQPAKAHSPNRQKGRRRTPFFWRA